MGISDPQVRIEEESGSLPVPGPVGTYEELLRNFPFAR